MRGWKRTIHGIVPLVVLVLISPATADTRSTCGWSVVPSPNKGPSHNDLRSVAAVSDRDAWAVGVYSDPTSRSNRPLVLHWDGRAWETVPAAVGTVGSLQGVTAVGPDDAWAVGSSLTATQAAAALALHWDGTRWSDVDVPAPRGPAVSTVLTDVVAIGPADAWAVGYWASVTDAPPRPLIEHWDGSAWEVAPTPELDSWSELHGVSATGPNDVWAVGNREVTVGSDLVERALIEHWDGAAWRVVRTPVPGPRLPFTLESVDARTPADAWAVGQVSRPGAVVGIAFHWNGARWAPVPPVSPSDRFQLVAGVAVAARHRVIAVGTYQASGRGERTLVERWNGRRWVQKPSGNRQSGDELIDVAVLPSQQFAVGSSWAHGGEGPQRTLVLQRCSS